MVKFSYRTMVIRAFLLSLPWRHNEHDGVSNHQPRNCLLNRLFRCRSRITSTLCVTGFCVGKLFPFYDVIMLWQVFIWNHMLRSTCIMLHWTIIFWAKIILVFRRKGWVMQSFDISFVMSLGKPLIQQSRGRWSETRWCKCGVIVSL